MRDGGQHAEMHNTPVIYRLQQRDTNVVVVTAASVGEASLQRLLGTISAVRAADGDSWWRGFWPGGDCSQRDEWTLRGGEETGELRRPRRPEPLRTEACKRPASSSNQVCRSGTHFCRSGTHFCRSGAHFCRFSAQFCRFSAQFCRFSPITVSARRKAPTPVAAYIGLAHALALSLLAWLIVPALCCRRGDGIG